jgi:hypothetical protein
MESEMKRPEKKSGRDKTTEEKADRPDGRRMTTLYLRPDIMPALKKAAIDERTNAYEIVEELVLAYLKKTKRI